MNYKKIILGMLLASNVTPTHSISEPIAWLATGGITTIFGFACYNVGPQEWDGRIGGRIGFFEVWRDGTLPERFVMCCLIGATAGVGYLTYKTIFHFTPVGRLNRAMQAVQVAKTSPLCQAVINNINNPLFIDAVTRVKATSKFPLIVAVEELIVIVERLNYAQDLCVCAQEDDSSLTMACIACLKNIESYTPALIDGLTTLKTAPGYAEQLNAYNRELARIAAESQAAAAWAANTRRP